MGGFGKVAASVFAADVKHIDGCQDAVVANKVMDALNEYLEIMAKFEEDTTSNEERAQLIEQACQSLIWGNEMVSWCQRMMSDLVNPDEDHQCTGCSNTAMKYMMEPLYLICGINERDKDNKFKELMEPLDKMCDPDSPYVKMMDSLH